MSSKETEQELMQEFFQKNSDVGKTYNESIAANFRKIQGLEETVRQMIVWHNGLIDQLVAKPVKKLLEETLRSPAGIAEKKEFKEAAKQFKEAVKKSHEKDDGFKKQAQDGNLAAWVFFAGEFLTSMRADLTVYKQETRKSGALYMIVIHRYCSSLFNAVRNNIRDEAGINGLFLKATELIVKWLQKTNPQSIAAIWGV